MDEPVAFDRRRIRIGLALLTIVLIACVVLFLVSSTGVVKAFAFAVGAVLVVRVVTLVRWLQRRSP